MSYKWNKNWLHDLMKETNLNQNQVAARLQTKRQNVNQWKHCETRPIAKIQENILNEFDLTPALFWLKS